MKKNNISVLFFLILTISCTTNYQSEVEWLNNADCNVELDRGAKGAKLCFKSEPKYPRTALNKGITGRVLVQFDVNALGETENITIIHAEPGSIFNDAAIDAVDDWEFIPGFKEGKAIKYKGLEYKLTFDFDDRPYISKATWLANLKSIFIKKRCLITGNPAPANCIKKVHEAFLDCKNNSSTIEALTSTNDINLMSKAGGELSLCISNKLGINEELMGSEYIFGINEDKWGEE